jgi:glucokinase
MGSGEGCENMVLATFGTGVGGGIIMDGRVLSGVHGSGGEIGHLVVNLHETEYCNCGKKGCVEQYCSATGIVQLAKQRLQATTTPSSLRSVENLTCKAVFDAGLGADPLALEILEQVYDYLGRFLADVCCVADPEIIVLGGGVSKAGKPLLEGVRRHYQNHAFHGIRDVRFALATLGNDAGAYGAMKLVLDRL